jgi:hypothetical protein
MMFVFPYLRAVNNPNEFVRVYTVMGLVESATFRVDEQVATFGWTNDMARVKGKDDGVDHYYMVKAPMIVYAGVPGYFLFSKVIAPVLGKKYPGVYGGHATAPAWAAASAKGAKAVTTTAEEKLWWLRMATWSMRLFGSQIPCFLFLVWLERYLREITPDAMIRYAAVAAAGLGTNYLAYTHMFASHSQYAALAFLAFATIERELRRSGGDLLKMRPSRAAFAGFCTSACVALEYHALFMTVVMSLFATLVFWSPFQAFVWVVGLVPPLRSVRRLIPLGASVTPTRVLAFAAGGLLNIPHVMYFHWTAYGNAFTPGHQKLETAHFAAEHQMGLWGVLWPSWDHIKALAIDPSFGFFGMSPYMWIGLLGGTLLLLMPLGAATQRRHTRITTLVWLACMAVVFGVNAGFVEWRAGWTVGPRYLVVCAPFFAYGGACALERFAAGSVHKRAVARGLGGGLALAGVVTIGSVGLVYDTLPETIARPFAQFSWPMARVGLVPHHVGEWFNWNTTTLWYVACAAMLLAPIVAGLAPSRGEKALATATRVATYVIAFAVGMVPAVTPPEDTTKLFVLHPTTTNLAAGWEPPGRDRITLMRDDAERLGSRGNGPCLFYRIADLERVIGQEAAAARDEARAKKGLPRERCPKTYF